MNERPNEADWFRKTVLASYQTRALTVKDCRIKYYVWGDNHPAKPGLLFIHGSFAHARWWDHIAPMFSGDFRVCALDLSGMGDSEHRKQYYTPDLFAEEIETVIDDAGLNGNVVLVGHSFGGSLARIVGSRHMRGLQGVVLVEPSRSRFFNLCASESKMLSWYNAAQPYSSMRAAMRRFRLQPFQLSSPRHAVRYLAERSLRQDGSGWVWKSDPHILSKVVNLETTQEEQIRSITEMTCPVGVISGARSHVYHRQYLQHYLPDELNVEIPSANHHAFLDKPFEFIETLRGMLNRWGLCDIAHEQQRNQALGA